MRHRVGSEGFRQAAELMRAPGDQGFWVACNDYELREHELFAEESVVATHALFDAEGIDEERWRIYSPLEETPDLFLKFARLHEERDFAGAALEWSRKYGVPGRRPEAMSLSAFRREVEAANRILMLYEAILNEDLEGAWSIVQEYPDEIIDSGIFEKLEENYVPKLEAGMLLAMHMVSRVVGKLCQPVLVLNEGSKPPYSRVTSGWDFDSLLGAMYLQMWWLMASGGDIARCEHCGRTISLSRPHPKGRKRRSDKRFCDAACRQAYHRNKKRKSS